MVRLDLSAKGAGVLVLAFLAVATSPAAPTLGLSSTACRVKNLDIGSTRRFQKAVDAASSDQRLTVRGVCHGITTIGKNLTIIGTRPPGAAKPKLDGDDGGSVIAIAPATTVTVRKLTIADGSGPLCLFGDECGGGIRNEGTLMLRDVTVRGNSAESGGGIYNDGTLVLRAVIVKGNTATRHGGGMITDLGSITRLNGSTVIRDNTAGHWGGGVYNGNAALTLNGAAVIRDNTASMRGGGVYNDAATLTLNGSASIHHNTAPAGAAGGVAQNGGTYNNVVCGGNVHHNIGGNCATF